MLVLGVDPGTASTGYGLVAEESGRLRAVEYGLVATDPEATPAERLLAIHRQLASILSRHRPHVVAVEELFFRRNVRTALAVGQARGIVLLAAAEAAVPVAEYTPPEVKQAVTGNGRAEKAQMQAMVRMLLGLGSAPRPDDVADALAVAICCLHRQGLERALARCGADRRTGGGSDQ